MAKQAYIKKCMYIRNKECKRRSPFDKMTSGIKTVVFRKFDMLDDKSSSSGLVLLTNIVYHIPDNIERFKNRG